MSVLSAVVTGDRRRAKSGEHAMQRPEVPFPKHWLYYIAIKLAVLAGGLALALRLYEVW